MQDYAPRFRFQTLPIPSTERETEVARAPIDIAEGWVIAQFRGNNECSDDKAIHYALDALSDHVALPRDAGNVRTRLQAMLERADAIGFRGRAVLVGCYALRSSDERYDVGGVESIWTLIGDAVKTERLYYQTWNDPL